jgi:hypothetical protein
MTIRGCFTVVVVALVVLSGCGGHSAPTSRDSGITGTVVAGPQCPVEVIGHPCPPRPVSATVTVEDQAGRTMTTFTSDEQGGFRVALPPGRYRLITQRANQPQLMQPVDVTVAAGTYTRIRLFLDTGIR